MMGNIYDIDGNQIGLDTTENHHAFHVTAGSAKFEGPIEASEIVVDKLTVNDPNIGPIGQSALIAGAVAASMESVNKISRRSFLSFGRSK